MVATENATPVVGVVAARVGDFAFYPRAAISSRSIRYRQFSTIMRSLENSSICANSIHLPSGEIGSEPIQSGIPPPIAKIRCTVVRVEIKEINFCFIVGLA